MSDEKPLQEGRDNDICIRSTTNGMFLRVINEREADTYSEVICCWTKDKSDATVFTTPESAIQMSKRLMVTSFEFVAAEDNS